MTRANEAQSPRESLRQDTVSFAELDVCGVESCPGDPLSLVCTLPVKHDGMHRQEGFPCRWEMAWELLLRDDHA